MSNDSHKPLSGLETLELHRIETQWAYDLAAEHELRAGMIVVIVHLPADDHSADPSELIPDERMFHVFLTPEAETDVLVRDNSNRRSDQDLRAELRRLFGR